MRRMRINIIQPRYTLCKQVAPPAVSTGWLGPVQPHIPVSCGLPCAVQVDLAAALGHDFDACVGTHCCRRASCEHQHLEARSRLAAHFTGIGTWKLGWECSLCRHTGDKVGGTCCATPSPWDPCAWMCAGTGVVWACLAAAPGGALLHGAVLQCGASDAHRWAQQPWSAHSSNHLLAGCWHPKTVVLWRLAAPGTVVHTR